MSWSFYGMGRPKAVFIKADEELRRTRCSEPEETIKLEVLGIIKLALFALPEEAIVEVRAGGSQSPFYKDSKPVMDYFNNSLNVEIKPVYGFLE